MEVSEPLEPNAAKRVIRQILDDGVVDFTQHARDEMKKDRLEPLDVENVLKGGVVDAPEWEREALRYRVRTPRIEVIVEFESAEVLVIVTAWRRSS